MMRVLLRLVEMQWFYATISWLYRNFATLWFGLRIEGVEHVPRDGGLVVAVNHISSLDPPTMGSAMPREISFMAKKELFERPASLLLMRGLHAFPIDRSRNDVGAIKEAMRRLKAGRVVGVFVQGTRNAGDIEALDGASFLATRAGVPLQPAGIFRDGRAFHVRFGEPFAVEGKGRAAMRATTTRTVHRINGLLPAEARIYLAGEAVESQGPAVRTQGTVGAANAQGADDVANAQDAVGATNVHDAQDAANAADATDTEDPTNAPRVTGRETPRDD